MGRFGWICSEFRPTEQGVPERLRFVNTPPNQETFLDAVPRGENIEQLEKARLRELEQDILETGQRLRAVTFGRLQDLLVPKWFGLVAEKHYREACKRLIRVGYIDGNEVGIKEATVLRFK